MRNYLVPRIGRCSTCGKLVPGYLLHASLRECEPPCPRCGCRPFHLDSIGPYTGNVGKMTLPRAIDFAGELDDPAEIEANFRLELIEHPPDGRWKALEALYDRYWWVSEFDDPGVRAKRLTLSQCIQEWKKELRNPESKRYYEGLSAGSTNPDTGERDVALFAPAANPVQDPEHA